MRLFWIVIPLVLFGIIGIQQSFGEESENISIIERNGFKFSVQTDKFHYDEKEPIAIKWKVENVGLDDIEYLKRSTCHDGFRFSVFDSGENKIIPLTSKAFLIKENDPIVGKFSIEFYAKILEEIQNEPTKEHDIIIFSTDKDATEKVLLKLGITKIYNSEFLSFVTARVTSADIPKIANYDFVTSIGDGELPVCGMAELTGVLHPQESLKGSFEWSQLIPSSNRDEGPRQVPDGFYSIEVEFNWMYNCLPVALGDIKSPNEIPKFDCGMERVVSGYSDEEKVRYFKINGFSENAIIDPVTHFLIEPSDLQSDDSSLFEKDFYLDELERDKFSSSVSEKSEISITEVNNCIDGKLIRIPFEIRGGNVTHTCYSIEDQAVYVTLDNVQDNGILTVKIPRILLDAKIGGCQDDEFFIMGHQKESTKNGNEILEIRDIKFRTFTIAFDKDAYKIWFASTVLPAPQPSLLECQKLIQAEFRPYEQIQYGIFDDDIICKENFELIFKSTNNSPACVKPSTAQKLLERGWTELGH